MNDNYSIHRALFNQSLLELEIALASGADVNAFDETKMSRPLTTAIQSIKAVGTRHAAIQMLLNAGADPTLLDDEAEKLGPLFLAVLAQDAVSLEMLLRGGADPNRELGTMGESLYDYAEFDYRYEIGWFPELPEKPDEIDRLDEGAWLKFLERLAIKYHQPTPDYLMVLRRFGARRLSESSSGLADDES